MVFADIEFYFLFLQDTVYHRPIFFYDVILYGIMIKHPKIGCIDSYFYFVDELLVVEVNGLHSLCIHLALKKQVGFGNGFTSQVMEECSTAGMFTDEVNHQHTE